MASYTLLKDSFIDLPAGGVRVYRISANEDFTCANGRVVKKHALGGYVESVCNLRHNGRCWVADDAVVYGDALVADNALVADKAVVSGDAKVDGDAVVCGQARVLDSAHVGDSAHVTGQAEVSGHSVVIDDGVVSGEATLGEYAQVRACARLDGEVTVIGKAKVGGMATLIDGTLTKIDDYVCVSPVGSPARGVTLNHVTGSVVSGHFEGTLAEYLSRGVDSPQVGLMLKMADILHKRS